VETLARLYAGDRVRRRKAAGDRSSALGGPWMVSIDAEPLAGSTG
jgi:hypothetical protein